MREPPDATTFICPNCHMPVDPTKPDAMMSAATMQWQHKDCWTPLKRKAPVIDPAETQQKREGS
ncbi:MAG: hypothetical protein DMD40_13725 [Gemmatimonadetes bacterium]|nr:MAG: hypothetical protein DMD40_13725 [Gemmatimonadota bacterium]